MAELMVSLKADCLDGKKVDMMATTWDQTWVEKLVLLWVYVEVEKWVDKKAEQWASLMD